MQKAQIRRLLHRRFSRMVPDGMAAPGNTSADKTRASLVNSCWPNGRARLTSGTNEPGIPE